MAKNTPKKPAPKREPPIRLACAGCDRDDYDGCLLYTSPSPRDQRGSRMPSSA